MDEIETLKALGPYIASVLVAFVTGLFALRSKSGDTRVAERRLDVDERAAISLERKGLEEQFKGLLAMFKQEAAEARADREVARKERDELRGQLTEATGRLDAQSDRLREMADVNERQGNELSLVRRVMEEMKAHMGDLNTFIRGLGHEPPKPPREW